MQEPTILLIEDDPQVQSLMRYSLEREGYLVNATFSGEEGLELLRETTPSLILLDNKLPGMDGFATCQRIRELFDIPVIMVTAMNEVDEKILGYEVGADLYITKPFSPLELLAHVKSVLRRYTDDNDSST